MKKLPFNIHNKSLGSALIVFVLVAVCLQSEAAIPIANGSTNIDRLPPNVWESLEKQAAAMSKITLTYSEVQTQQPSAGPFSFPPTSNYLYFNKNCVYSRTVYSYLKDQNLGRPILHEDAFDGIYYYDGNRNFMGPGDTNSILVKYLPSDKTDPEISSPVRFQYLKSAHFYVPDTIAGFVGFSAVESLVLHDMAQSDATQVKQEGEMLRVTVHIPDPLVLAARAVNLQTLKDNLEQSHVAPNDILKQIDGLKQMANMDKWHTVTFWLHPKYGYAVVKSEEFAPTGQKTISTDCDQWEYFESAKVWLPRHSVVSLFYGGFQVYEEFSDAPIYLITDTLIDASFTLPQYPVFSLAYNEPGSYFSDRSTSQAAANVRHQVNYTMAANSNVIAGIVSDVSRNMNHRPSILWDCIFAILAILPLILFIISFIRKRLKINEK